MKTNKAGLVKTEPVQNLKWTTRVKKDFKKYKILYLMAVPVLAYYIIFHYVPMYGVLMAFKDFNAMDGVWGSAWVGLKHFKDFFTGVYFERTLFNTLAISLSDIIFGFPAPIILALLLNELRSAKYKKIVQTVTYLPHFVSLMIICAMILDFTRKDGFINSFLSIFGVEPKNWMTIPSLFRPIFVGTNIWQGVGWGSIIYISALSGISQDQYEAASIDGAGRWKQMLYVTLPGIAPTIIIMLIMKMGQVMNVGFEKVILLYNPLTYDTADVISSFVYRRGIIEADYSYSAAVGLFNSVINLILLVSTNFLSRKLTDTSLW